MSVFWLKLDIIFVFCLFLTPASLILDHISDIVSDIGSDKLFAQLNIIFVLYSSFPDRADQIYSVGFYKIGFTISGSVGNNVKVPNFLGYLDLFGQKWIFLVDLRLEETGG